MVGVMVPSAESKMSCCSSLMMGFDSVVNAGSRVMVMVSFFRVDGSGFQSGVLFFRVEMFVAADFLSSVVASLAESMTRS